MHQIKIGELPQGFPRDEINMKRAVQYHKGSYSITIPSDIVSKFGLQKGSVLLFDVNNEGFYVHSDHAGYKKEIFTIGYEGRTLSQFIDILKNNGIQQLIDVREIAYSRKSGFSKTALSKGLAENDIVYRHFPQLGTPKEIREQYYESHNFSSLSDMFEKHFRSSNAKEILFDIIGLTTVRKSALMCFERSASKCHRSIVAQKMASEGFEVVNL